MISLAEVLRQIPRKSILLQPPMENYFHNTVDLSLPPKKLPQEGGALVGEDIGIDGGGMPVALGEEVDNAAA